MREALLELAKAAEAAMATVAGAWGERVGTGSSGDPTSRIDRAMEDAVLARVEALDLPVNVLTEERGLIDRGHEDLLVVDPLDGTVNAIRGVGVCSVSLAVGRGALSGIAHGLVYDLRTREAYYAERGKGATLDGRPIRTRRLADGSTLFLVYLGQSAHPDSAKIAAAGRRTRALGSAAIELSLVARGAANLYYVNSEARAQLRVVDIAAGVLLVREAGGLVVDLERRPLDIPLAPDARTNLIAAGDEAVLEALP